MYYINQYLSILLFISILKINLIMTFYIRNINLSRIDKHFPTPIKSSTNDIDNLVNLHNAKTIIMPALSSTMTTGKIVRWNKKSGDSIKVM